MSKGCIRSGFGKLFDLWQILVWLSLVILEFPSFEQAGQRHLQGEDQLT
jgi:hypothetical protein